MAGGPCPNPNGQCFLNITAKCTGTASKIWYGKKGSKYCKACYNGKQDKGSSSADSPSSTITGKRLLEEDVNELEYLLGAEGRISELHAILDQRCGLGSNRTMDRKLPSS